MLSIAYDLRKIPPKVGCSSVVKYDYARVSTFGHILAAQLDPLKAEGVREDIS